MSSADSTRSKRKQVSTTSYKSVSRERLARLGLRLKRCPFCGGKATMMRWQAHDAALGQVRYFIATCYCGVHPSFSGSTKKEVSKKWNRRV